MRNVQNDTHETSGWSTTTTLENPFDSIESGSEYLGLLSEALGEGKRTIQEEIAAIEMVPAEQRARRLEALQLVSYKLAQLEQHLDASSRILKNLKTLRRLLFGLEEG